ncbi:MAG TPA: hypothetical protein PK339_12540 [Flavitalea sp.]|nr:hypothetical protein [Flavitalea sp.]
MKIYTNISQTQLSVARHYGACTINGDRYIYIPQHDALIEEGLMKEYNKFNGNFEEFIKMQNG